MTNAGGNTTQPAPGGEAAIIPRSLVIWSAAGALFAIVAWKLVGPLSLLLDLIAVVLVGVLSYMSVPPDFDGELEGALTTAISRWKMDIAKFSTPLVVGLLTAIGAGLTHTDRTDLCEDYSAMIQEGESVGYSDNPYFRAISALAATAQDYKDEDDFLTEEVRAEGDSLETIGDSTRTTTGEVAAASGTIQAICSGE